MPGAQRSERQLGRLVGGDVAAQRGPQRAEDGLAGLGHRPHHDDTPGREQVARDRQLPADQPGGVADHPDGARIAAGQQRHQARQRERAVLGAQRVQDGRDGGVGVQAAALAAAAERAALVDGRVADLARAAGGAADQGAVHEQAAPDAVVELDGDAVVAAPPGAPQVLAQGRQVRVVVDAHRHAQGPLDVRAGHAVPAGEHPGGFHRVRMVPDGTGQRDPGADQGVVGQAGRGERLVQQPPRDGQALGAGVAVRQVALAGADDVVREVAEQDPQPPEAELDPGHRAVARVQRQPQARAACPRPLGGARTAGPDDYPARDQVLDDRADRGRSDLRVAGELGPAHRASFPQRRQHELAARPRPREPPGLVDRVAPHVSIVTTRSLNTTRS